MTITTMSYCSYNYVHYYLVEYQYINDINNSNIF